MNGLYKTTPFLFVLFTLYFSSITLFYNRSSINLRNESNQYNKDCTRLNKIQRDVANYSKVTKKTKTKNKLLSF